MVLFMNRKKLLLVDGSNLLFQMFYGMPARIVNSKGLSIHGVMGFIGALIKIINMVSPSNVVVIFDSECENERCVHDTEYKSNRIDYSEFSDEENPFFQLPLIYKALAYMKIKHFEVKTGETDDVIASYAIRYGKETEICISSFDSDFFQLINENVSVLRYKGKNSYFCNCKYVEEKFGISPKQYADFKSLTGDKADNIKGAGKIGIKTASNLLQEFGTLENIIQNSHYIKKPSVRKSIVDFTERLKLNKSLITLCDKADLHFDLLDLEVDLIHLKSLKTRKILMDTDTF